MTNADPLAEYAVGILAHMNADHGDALRLYARALAGLAPADAERVEAVTMIAIDQHGFDMRAELAGGEARELRVEFDAPVRSRKRAREVLVALVGVARERLA